MELDDKNLIYVRMLVFYDYSVFKWVMIIFYFAIFYAYNLLKNWTVVKNQHTNIDKVFTIKFHNRSIHSNV